MCVLAISAGGGRDFLHICRGVRGVEAVHLSQVHGSERLVHHCAEHDTETILLQPVVDAASPARLLVGVGVGCGVWCGCLFCLVVIFLRSITFSLFRHLIRYCVVSFFLSRDVWSWFGIFFHPL